MRQLMQKLAMILSQLGQFIVWLGRAVAKRFQERKFRPGQWLYYTLVDHFIPHERNNHKPQVLRHRALLGYSVFLVLLKVAAILVPVALPSSSLFSSAITPNNIVELTNQTRLNLGLGELKVNSLLTAAAAAKANDILAKQYFAHTSPEGLTPWSWIERAGYDYLYAGENLAVHYQSAEDVDEGWLASPTHRANIVQPKYAEIGVGVAMGDFEGVSSTIVVQMFGTPVATGKLAQTTPVPTTRLANIPVKPVPTKTVNTGKVAAAEVKSNPVVKKPIVKSEPVRVVTAVPTPPVPTVSAPVIDQSELAMAVTKEAVRQEADIKNAPVATQPIIYDTSTKIALQSDSYLVNLAITGATAVMVQLADQWIPLTRAGNSSIWQGAVPFNVTTFNKSGEQLSVVAWSAGGQVVSKALAWVAPLVPTQQFYNFNEGTDKYAKLLGVFTIHNLQDKVRQFYFFFIVFLAAALLLNILVKIRVQHFSLISHTLLVIGLTLVLLVV